jgi:glutamate-1-semialdehyde 2,1-aminomutase
MINNGVWMAPGGDEEWTISMQHTTEDVSRVVETFRKFARDVHEKIIK